MPAAGVLATSALAPTTKPARIGRKPDAQEDLPCPVKNENLCFALAARKKTVVTARFSSTRCSPLMTPGWTPLATHPPPAWPAAPTA
jgi:hypothetical protein